MYTYILEAALRDRSRPDVELTTDETLAVLFECRQHLESIASSERSGDWGSAALANQVAFDLALIDLVKSVGLDCDTSSFDQPQRRRLELERELIALGIPLDELHKQASST
jgi:hypothetical protein